MNRAMITSKAAGWPPAGAQARDAEDLAYDGIDLTGCYSYRERVIRIAETLGRPVMASRIARFLVRSGTTQSLSVDSIRRRVYEIITPSPDFVSIGDGLYQYLPLGHDESPELLTVGGSEDKQGSLEYG